MRVLVVSSTPWDKKNSFGLSFSNIFEGMNNLQFVNVYCSAGSPDNNLSMECFQISESMLVENLKNSNKPSGKRVKNKQQEGTERSVGQQKRFDIARTLRWQVLFWMRDFLWKIGRWKSKELMQFLDEFQPDLIFQPVYFSSYMNDIAQFVKEYTGAPMVGYISDDNYTLRQLRISPLYWIDRFWKRGKVKKTINMCEILYVISDIQKHEYECLFKPPCKILTKCADFNSKYVGINKNEGKLTLLYGGNIGSERWKSLGLISSAIEKLRYEGYDIQLDIYTGTPCNKAMKKVLLKKGCYLHEPVTYDELLTRQQKADIVVHVEGLSLRSRLEVRQSFSTKIVDFFEMGKCIFAIGTEDVASIKHLKDNDAAIIASNEKDTYERLKEIIEIPERISLYEKKAYDCGVKYHQRKDIQRMLLNDFRSIMNCKGEI